ncbi:ABC transporter permease [Croceicoccus naphthovorans]|uniref:ABC transporter permease n=1 Tax=Croceicoccus naphthovorans TaxID=1348774 RepID=A0A0G3XFV4_9SPHN|nr:FtsX-like permease family protein [Croceicoccus naphthovorans]AKM09514.1 ABC transporter permease [Croceicoccus naphthovorans]MBB3989744.1 putative ABC transport system permease protein [Croceicoccus naphthovorans]
MSEAAQGWPLALRLARRDFSWRFRGLRLLVVCLFLGAAALAAIGTLETAIRDQLSDRGQEILGGDLEFSAYGREASADELAAMQALGRVSWGTRVQSLATTGDATAPVQLKSVDDAWPLYGTFRLRDGREAGAPPAGEAWVDKGVLDRLDAEVGDMIGLGRAQVRIGGVIAEEPDRLSEGFSLGPPVIISDATMAQTDLIQPGSMARAKYRVALTSGQEPDAAVEGFETQFPDASWDTRTRERASPGADRLMANMGQFLGLVGLAALVIAGIGISGAVSSWLEGRRGTVATLKVLGATSEDVLRLHALQVLAAAFVGVGAGLIVGVLAVPGLAALLEGLLPIDAGFVIAPLALVRAAVFALLVALVFAAPPLLAARSITAMALLRARGAPPPGIWRAAAKPVLAGLAAIVVLALATAHEVGLTAGFLAAAACILGLLAALGLGIRKAAARLPRRGGSLAVRMGLAALDRPGSPTVALVTALGFGLSAFAAIAAIQTSLDAYIAATVPEQAPDYFVLDLPRDGERSFRDLVEEEAPGSQVRTVPSMRGAILAYGPPEAMTRVSDLEDIPEGAWALRGERGLTYATEIPPGNAVTSGAWWPADYDGPPLVSVDQELADALDLKVGDHITISLLGIERDAEIASLRQVEWEDMGFNYVLVFSPGAIDDAPHNLYASIMVGAGADGGPLLGALVRAFPTSSVIEIGGVLEQARDILGSLALAIFAAASVAVLAGLAVLLGAIAAARARETYDSVILRVLGASRGQLLGALVVRYALLALVLGVVGMGIGMATGWFVIDRLFEFPFRPDWAVVTAVVIGGGALVVGAATLASLPVLHARPAQALRSL